jgi:hypothetical protein
MVTNANLYVGHPNDPLPDAVGNIVLLRTNGDIITCIDGDWRMVFTQLSVPKSIHAMLLPNKWMSVRFKGKYHVVPGYWIKCTKISDPNTIIDSYEIRALTPTGFEIFVTEACTIDVNEFTVEDNMQEFVKEVGT